MDLMIFGVSWLWWALGTFGVVGTALLIWLAPAFLVRMVQAILNFCFTTRIGAALLAASIAFFIADTNRSRRDASEFAERTAIFEQAQKDRDAKIEADTRADVLKEIASQALKDTATDTQVKDFHDALPAIPTTDACNDIVRVGNNADRLRAIAGTPVRRSGGAKGVPKARKKAAHP